MIKQLKNEFISNKDILENGYDKLNKKLDFYNLEDYYNDINEIGLAKIWEIINDYALELRNINNFLSVDNFAELYEIGLAYENKNLKKQNGQYYTPTDVAIVMSKWFDDIEGQNICDVACGTGKLILTYFNLIGEKRTKEILEEGKLYLYDLDKTALSICKTIILVKYGLEYASKIHDISCDFLNRNIKLPENSKVISNPPYAKINSISNDWDKTDVVCNTKELYSIFMEKIIKQSKSSVIITPYSFMGADKFYSLRYVLNDYSGFIVSFDNVPGNIFCGRKHGIFNTNTANSVRAAITVVDSRDKHKGFKTTPLIRFKNEERIKLLKNEVLENLIANKYQIINKECFAYEKCFKELEELLELWKEKSDSKLKDLLSKDKTQYVLYVPNTCRYFTTAAKRKLTRSGVIELFFKSEIELNIAYLMLNSSFAYWWWRIFDGGITYPKNLLTTLPVFYKTLSNQQMKKLKEIVSRMMELEDEYVVKKLNAGVEQENIKFPKEYRNNLNNYIFNIMNYNGDEKTFDLVHCNNVFGE